MTFPTYRTCGHPTETRAKMGSLNRTSRSVNKAFCPTSTDLIFCVGQSPLAGDDEVDAMTIRLFK